MPKTELMVSQIAKIRYLETATEIDALLLEAEVVRKMQPKYNSELKDNKSYPRVKITKGSKPLVLIVRNEKPDGSRYFGPYPQGQKIRWLLRNIRKVFPYYTEKHRPEQICFRGHLGLCPCGQANWNKILERSTINNIAKILRGERPKLISDLTKAMKSAAKENNFETALKLKNQIDILTNLGVPAHQPWEYETNPNLVAERNIQKVQELCGLLKFEYKDNFRIEGYDISHVSGSSVVASMVVFTSGVKDTGEYRRFKIKTDKNNDFAAMFEVLSRRKHNDWRPPDLVLIDGGTEQVKAAQRASDYNFIGLAKRDETIILGNHQELRLPRNTAALKLLQEIRDEAHRFAQNYHKKLRSRKMLQ